MRLNEILVGLTDLPKEDLAKVVQRAKYLLTLNGSTKVVAGSGYNTGSPLIDVLILYSKKYTDVPSKELLLNLNTYKARERLEFIAKELESISEILELTRKECLRLCDVLIEAGVLKLRELNKPVSFRSLLFLISEPRSLFQEAYPGYFGNELFRRIVLNREKIIPLRE